MSDIIPEYKQKRLLKDEMEFYLRVIDAMNENKLKVKGENSG